MKYPLSRMMYSLIGVSLILVVTLTMGCAHKPIEIKLGSEIEGAVIDLPVTLEVCLDFSTDIDSEDKLMHINAINHFINRYNNKASYYILVPCTKGEKKAIKLTIQNTRYVPPSEQALYVVVSAIGVYSVFNGGFGLVWAGFNTTTLGIDLSKDIAVQQKTVYRQFSSSPFFLELTSVKRKHMKQFETFMFQLLNELQANEIKN